MHAPGAQKDKTMHPAIFLYAHFYIKIVIMLNIHAHVGCTGFKNPCTQQPKCAHQVRDASLISNTEDA